MLFWYGAGGGVYVTDGRTVTGQVVVKIAIELVLVTTVLGPPAPGGPDK